MNTLYSNDRAVQMLVYLLKANMIKKIVVSPGTTNMPFVVSVQHDPYFELFSCVDERSAAYMACGMSIESGEPVVITCTEATASRNYMSALTEAYYKKIPILAVTGAHSNANIGHLYEQIIDRRVIPNDIALLSVTVDSNEEEWLNNIRINQAILELTHRGGGPVHINLIAHTFETSTDELPITRIIKRYTAEDKLPSFPKGRIAIFAGAQLPLSKHETLLIDKFCEEYDSVVFCNQSSSYYGKYRIEYALISSQKYYNSNCLDCDLLIHIGETSTGKIRAKQTWRISPDGELRDTFRSLSCIFEMQIETFLSKYIHKSSEKPNQNYFNLCTKEYKELYDNIKDLKFTNLWIAQYLSNKIPSNSIIHLGILNSFRCWNFVKIESSITRSCNVGGFGIDGVLSTAIGSSLVSPDKICFCILGDLSFFYDLNSIGNRHIGKNLRILLINNGRGEEFRNYGHPGHILGDFANSYIAAEGHFGNKSRSLVKNFVEDLGYQYISASSKDEFKNLVDIFTSSSNENSIVFEVFTLPEDESDSLKRAYNLKKERKIIFKERIKKTLKDSIHNTISFLKK